MPQAHTSIQNGQRTEPSLERFVEVEQSVVAKTRDQNCKVRLQRSTPEDRSLSQRPAGAVVAFGETQDVRRADDDLPERRPIPRVPARRACRRKVAAVTPTMTSPPRTPTPRRIRRSRRSPSVMKNASPVRPRHQGAELVALEDAGECCSAANSRRARRLRPLRELRSLGKDDAIAWYGRVTTTSAPSTAAKRSRMESLDEVEDEGERSERAIRRRNCARSDAPNISGTVTICASGTNPSGGRSAPGAGASASTIRVAAIASVPDRPSCARRIASAIDQHSRISAWEHAPGAHIAPCRPSRTKCERTPSTSSSTTVTWARRTRVERRCRSAAG